MERALWAKNVNDLAEFAAHGGGLHLARRLFPDAPQPWIDLSTGINPRPYPFAAVPEASWMRLPDAAGLAELERVAAARYGAPAGVSVVAAPGTQAIIQHLPALAPGRDVRILGPTYSEFERVFRASDARVGVTPDLPALVGADVAVLVNPNNPDGRFLPADQLLSLAPRVGVLIVDEAYVDAFGPSLIPRLPANRAIVLRSFGKMYGLGGLRLGFAVTSRDRADALRRRLGPWAVSGPAIVIGTEALADDAWLTAAKARLRADGARLDFLLRQTGAAAIGGTPLFRLVSHPVAPDLFRALARRGLLTRPFAKERNWLRLGLPGREQEWDRLEAALRAFR